MHMLRRTLCISRIGKSRKEKENKEFALKLFDFVQKKLEQKDDNTPLEVPKSMA